MLALALFSRVSRRQLLVVAVAGLMTLAASPFLPLAQGSDTESDAGPVSLRLTVVVTGLRSNRGNVVLSLFHGDDGFPGDSKKALVSRIVSLTDVTVVGGEANLPITLDGLAPGDYAVALFHDENENGKLDERWGIPTEGFGFSNNPRIRWGAPSYKDTRLTLSAREHKTTITVSLKYLRGSHR